MYFRSIIRQRLLFVVNDVQTALWFLEALTGKVEDGSSL
jgi:hypothetical protein